MIAAPSHSAMTHVVSPRMTPLEDANALLLMVQSVRLLRVYVAALNVNFWEMILSVSRQQSAVKVQSVMGGTPFAQEHEHHLIIPYVKMKAEHV